MDPNDILNRRFAAVYDELMQEVGVSSGRTYAMNWIIRHTTKMSGRNSYESYVTVMDVLDDYNNGSYVGKRGFGPTTRNYFGIFIRMLRERAIGRSEKIQYIGENVTRDALYTQLAEECAELAHAALKMTRLYRDDDKTIDERSMDRNIIEEFNDVLNLIDVLGYNKFGSTIIMDAKINRWYERLMSKKEHMQNDG